MKFRIQINYCRKKSFEKEKKNKGKPLSHGLKENTMKSLKYVTVAS